MWGLLNVVAMLSYLDFVLSRPNVAFDRLLSTSGLPPPSLSEQEHPLHRRQISPAQIQSRNPPIISQHIRTGLAMIQQRNEKANIMQIRASPPPGSTNHIPKTTLNTDDFKDWKLSISFDTPTLPQTLREKGYDLTASTANTNGDWSPSFTHEKLAMYLTDPIASTVQMDITTLDEKLSTALIAALQKLNTLHLADPSLKSYRIFARPSLGLLSLSLPMDIYIEFRLANPKPAYGQPKAILYGLASENLFIDPTSEDSGLLRNTSPIPPPAAGTQFWREINSGVQAYSKTWRDIEILQVQGYNSLGSSDRDPLNFNDINIIISNDMKSLPLMCTKDKGRTWTRCISFYGGNTPIAVTPFNWALTKNLLDLSGAVQRVYGAVPGFEDNVGHWRLFVRPDKDGLAKALPRGLYYEFTPWREIKGEGEEVVRVVYVAAATGDVFIDPVMGDSGLVRDRSPIPEKEGGS